MLKQFDSRVSGEKIANQREIKHQKMFLPNKNQKLWFVSNNVERIPCVSFALDSPKAICMKWVLQFYFLSRSQSNDIHETWLVHSLIQLYIHPHAQTHAHSFMTEPLFVDSTHYIHTFMVFAIFLVQYLFCYTCVM